jgi:hypothetical protein
MEPSEMIPAKRRRALSLVLQCISPLSAFAVASCSSAAPGEGGFAGQPGAASTTPELVAQASLATRTGPRSSDDPLRSRAVLEPRLVPGASYDLGFASSSKGGYKPMNDPNVQVYYHGGSLGSGVWFQPVFWSNQVASDIQGGAYTAMKAIVRQANKAYLAEYDEPGQPLEAPNKILTPITITLSQTYNTVGDAQIVTELANQFNHVPGTLGNLRFSAGIVYVNFLPPSIANGTSNSCAHHLYGTYDNKPYPYIDIPDSSMRTCGIFPETMTGYNLITTGLSHEMAETLTDLLPGFTNASGAQFDGWNGPAGEIGDICRAIPRTAR